MRLAPVRLIFAILVSCSAGAAAAAEFRAGAHAGDITPTVLPAPVNGNMVGRMTSTVTDPMHARSFALHDGKNALILCVVDSCMVPREICEQTKAIAARATGVPAARLLISATHSHTCATMTGVFQSEPDPAYVATLPGRIAASMIQAYRNLEPAEIAWGRDEDRAQVFNRRWHLKPGATNEDPFGGKTDRVMMNPGFSNPKIAGPAGPVDPDVYLLAARAKADGRPLAVLANYSLHYVGGWPGISADYFAAFANEVGKRLGAGDARYAGKPAFVGILSNGTSGNINNVDYSAKTAPPRRAPGEQIATVAANVADAALRAWGKLAWTHAAPLASAERDVTLAVRKPGPAELERARDLLAKSPKNKDGQYTERAGIYARETVLMADYPAQVPVKLQAHRIGGLTIGAIPCEVFVEIGLDLKATKPLGDHFTISLANGYNGYLPTPEHHALGGYETWRARSSYLEVEAAPKIAAALQELLREVARR